MTGACASVGNPGYGMVRTSFTARSRPSGALSRTRSFSTVRLHPISSKTGRIPAKWVGSVWQTVTSPPVAAPQQR